MSQSHLLEHYLYICARALPSFAIMSQTMGMHIDMHHMHTSYIGFFKTYKKTFFYLVHLFICIVWTPYAYATNFFMFSFKKVIWHALSNADNQHTHSQINCLATHVCTSGPKKHNLVKYSSLSRCYLNQHNPREGEKNDAPLHHLVQRASLVRALCC